MSLSICMHLASHFLNTSHWFHTKEIAHIYNNWSLADFYPCLWRCYKSKTLLILRVISCNVSDEILDRKWQIIKIIRSKSLSIVWVNNNFENYCNKFWGLNCLKWLVKCPSTKWSLIISNKETPMILSSVSKCVAIETMLYC